MKSIEIIEKKEWKSEKAKLTLTPTRISIKISSKMDIKTKERIKKFFLYCDKKINHPKSLRGQLLFSNNIGYYITLYEGKHTKKIITFLESDIYEI
jgi:hypothetical protein